MTSRSRPMLRAGHARAKLQRRMSVSMWSGVESFLRGRWQTESFLVSAPHALVERQSG